jgi:hypothetical protein
LGGRVRLFGVTGADEAARDLRKSLTRLHIAGQGVIGDARRTTTVKTRIIARHQQVVRVDREHRDMLSPAIEQSLIRRINASLPKLDVLVLSDYDKGVVTDALAERVLEESHRRGVPTLVKPKTSRLFAYRFSAGRGLKGHSFGNLFLTAMTQVLGDFHDQVLLAVVDGGVGDAQGAVDGGELAGHELHVHHRSDDLGDLSYAGCIGRHFALPLSECFLARDDLHQFLGDHSLAGPVHL